MTTTSASSATQKFVPIDHIRDGVVTMKNGELRAVLMTNSLNLSLKGEDEQMAIITQFQSMLNSLDFPIQFFAQSRRLNIKPYIELLENRSKEVKEDLLKLQISEYIGFIKKFTSETNIMTKHFFVIIPYMPSIASKNGGSSFLSFGGNNSSVKQESNSFEEARIQLEQRVATVAQGMVRFGIRSQRLNTEEVVELFYKMFNPGEQDNPAPKLAENN